MNPEKFHWGVRLAILALLLFLCWTPVFVFLHLIGLLD